MAVQLDGDEIARLECCHAVVCRERDTSVCLAARLTGPDLERGGGVLGPGRGCLAQDGVGVVAAAGVAYAAWQTLRADDELWVADDPLRAPDA